MSYDFKVGDYVRSKPNRGKVEKFCIVTQVVDGRIYGRWHEEGEETPVRETWMGAGWIKHVEKPKEEFSEYLDAMMTPSESDGGSCAWPPPAKLLKPTKYQASILCECKECEREFKAANREVRELKEEIARLQNEAKHQKELRDDAIKSANASLRTWQNAHEQAIARNKELTAQNTRLKDDLEQLTKINATEGMF